MIGNAFVWHLPTEAIYMAFGAFAQWLLILYCIGHSGRSGEKWALIRWLFIFSLVILGQGIAEIIFTTYDIPTNTRNSSVVLKEQIILSIFAWMGLTGIDFFFRYLKRKETWRPERDT